MVILRRVRAPVFCWLLVGFPIAWAAPGCARREISPNPRPDACTGERIDGATCIIQVTGRVVDEDDRPVSDLDVTVCGPICFRGVTTGAGSFAIDINYFLVISQYSVQAHGSPLASTFYHRLPQPTEEGTIDVGVLRVLGLPSDGPVLVTKLDLDGDPAPSQKATSGTVTLSVGSGTVVRLSVSDALDGEEGARFRALELADEQTEEFAPGLVGARVFALGPFEADFTSTAPEGPQVSLSVGNTGDWPPGSPVEVLALGTYLDPDWLTPSEFEPMGLATVSADGTTIDYPSGGDEGSGLRHLTWLALRLGE